MSTDNRAVLAGLVFAVGLAMIYVVAGPLAFSGAGLCILIAAIARRIAG